MNKKEISEIKRLFTMEKCCITRICGCLVDGEKQKKAISRQAFLSLSEEEQYKYFDIFRKSLSGTVGKNLLTLDFPLEQEKEGGTQAFLLRLLKSNLEEDELLDAFYDRIIETYEYPENYYITLLLGAYDIPGRSSDGLEMYDASEEVYFHILCCICPVNLSKAGLCYNAQDECIEDRIRDWLVEMPETGFLFPAFTDRQTDLHSLLYYAKKADTPHADFAAQLLGLSMPLPPVQQKDSFQALVEETLGEECKFETVVQIHEKLCELIEQQKEEPEPVTLNAGDVEHLLRECGASGECFDDFQEKYDTITGPDTDLVAANITNTRKLEVRTPSVVIQIPPDQAGLLEERLIDGRKCLVIPLDTEVEVNGIRLSSAVSD